MQAVFNTRRAGPGGLSPISLSMLPTEKSPPCMGETEGKHPRYGAHARFFWNFCIDFSRRVLSIYSSILRDSLDAVSIGSKRKKAIFTCKTKRAVISNLVFLVNATQQRCCQYTWERLCQFDSARRT